MAGTFGGTKSLTMGAVRGGVEVHGFADLVDFSQRLQMVETKLRDKILRRVHRKLARWATAQLARGIAKNEGILVRAVRQRVRMFSRGRDLSKVWAGVQPIGVNRLGRVRSYGKRGQPGSGVRVGSARYEDAFIAGGKLGSKVYRRVGVRQWSISEVKHDFSDGAFEEFSRIMRGIEKRGGELLAQEVNFAFSKL